MATGQVEAESTYPCTRVKHIAVLLRKKEISQQDPSIYEDRTPKIIEELKKQVNT